MYSIIGVFHGNSQPVSLILLRKMAEAIALYLKLAKEK